MYNGISQVYCIKPDGIIQLKKAYHYDYHYCALGIANLLLAFLKIWQSQVKMAAILKFNSLHAR